MGLISAPPHRGFFNSWTRAHAVAALVPILAVFVATAAYTTYKTNNYLAIFWRIAHCDWRPPGKNFVMVYCRKVVGGRTQEEVIPYLYRNGALLFDIDPRLTAAARRADVILTGNSTAFATFATKIFDNQIEHFFRKKGLRIFIVAAEGSGFRLRKIIFDKLQLRPKITIPTLDDLQVDVLQDWNRDLVFSPDQFVVPFRAVRLAIELQYTICTMADDSAEGRNPLLRSMLSWLPVKALQAIYCNGNYKTYWRNLDTGLEPIYWEKRETLHQQILESPDSSMVYFDMYWRRAKMMMSSPTLSKSCLIFHLIPSSYRSYDGLAEVAKRLGKPFVFPEIKAEKNWWMFDGSHMDDDLAERWTAEFLTLLEPHIDTCLAGK